MAVVLNGGALGAALRLCEPAVVDDLRLVRVEDLLALCDAGEQPEGPHEEEDEHEEERKVDLLEHVHQVLVVLEDRLGDVLQHLVGSHRGASEWLLDWRMETASLRRLRLQ